MTTVMKVFSPHVFRVHADEESEHLPIKVEGGRHFYLVTPSPHAPPSKKRYLYDLVRNKKGMSKIIVIHGREQAKKFDNLRLAESFADMLADPNGFRHEYDFWIVLEPPKYEGEKITEKAKFIRLANAF